MVFRDTNTLIFNTNFDVFYIRFGAGVQLGATTQLSVTMEGYDNNPVTLDWNGGAVAYAKFSDANVLAFFVANVGNDIPVIVETL